MTIFKRLEAHSDEELIQVFQNAPNLFYRLSLQHTLRGTEHYKACALAALRGLAEKAGHHFPSKSNGNLGWDAHHVTKRIFEEQSVFDPYADKAFQDEAVKLCCYYVLRYVAPDQLPKDTDYSLDQFASCFSSKGVLYLRKRGCDFYPDDPESKQSDLGNHRLFLEYSNKNGQYIVGDVSCANRLITSKSGKSFLAIPSVCLPICSRSLTTAHTHISFRGIQRARITSRKPISSALSTTIPWWNTTV